MFGSGAVKRSDVFLTSKLWNSAHHPERVPKALAKTLADKLEDYNSAHPIMDLVLFEAAMEHVARIARILGRPGGHALLIGVGGSGKQSLSRLAAHICGLEVRQLSITARFTLGDLKDALKEMVRAAGVKGVGTVFLLTDSQIVNERFLVPINDLLASGWVPDLFERDELDALLGSLRGEAKAAGVLTDNPEEMLAFFVSRVRANLHIVLCCSPVGDVFRVRARRFPGLISATSIDRFTPWPEEALVSVAARFIADLDLGFHDGAPDGPEQLGEPRPGGLDVRDDDPHVVHLAQLHLLTPPVPVPAAPVR